MRVGNTAFAMLRDARWLTVERANLYGFGLLVAYLLAAVFKAAFEAADLGVDFRVYWAASSFVLYGHPSHAYAAAGFLYPPIYLLVCWPLALLPFAASALAWTAATGAIFVAAIHPLVRRGALVAAAALPAAWFNAFEAQNGFLSAALLVAGFRWLDERPILAGIAFGCLSYKPQMAVLLPVVLVAGGRWRALTAAAVTVLALAAASVIAFGLEPWGAFLASLPVDRLGPAGADDFYKLASVGGAALMIGLPAAASLALQFGATLAVCIILVVAGRRCRAPLALGAVTCLCIVLASPWIHYYDLTVLALPTAWLANEGARKGWRPGERITLLLVFLLPFVGFAAAMAARLPLTAATLILLLAFTASRGIPAAKQEAVALPS
jgi:alpha-1,2-mannosyltransferase